MNSNENNQKMYIAVPLDQMSESEALLFLKHTVGDFHIFKIGLELFYRCQPNQFFHKIQDLFREIPADDRPKLFLDLKLHDIPQTVFGAIQSLKSLHEIYPISYLTLHLSGGKNMIQNAILARDQFLPHCKLLGVSFLTHLSEEDMSEIYGNVDHNHKLFRDAFELQIDGLVHSGREDFLFQSFLRLSVCPGIRFLDELQGIQLPDDQKRIVTPQHLINRFQSMAGTRKELMMVIGRPLTEAFKNNPELYQKRIDELNTLLKRKL